jgi:hypothetical protein
LVFCAKLYGNPDWDACRGRKPEKIIYFRDGVSEGQFEEVVNREISAIQRACKSLEDGYEPGITFLVVQARIEILPKSFFLGILLTLWTLAAAHTAVVQNKSIACQADVFLLYQNKEKNSCPVFSHQSNPLL